MWLPWKTYTAGKSWVRCTHRSTWRSSQCYNEHLQRSRPGIFTCVTYSEMPSHRKTMLIIAQPYGSSNKTNLIGDQSKTWSLGLAPLSWEPANVSHLMCHDNIRQGVTKCSPPTHVILSEHQGSVNSPFVSTPTDFVLKKSGIQWMRQTPQRTSHSPQDS